MTVYTVNSGDSLYEIAKKFGADVDLLARDNELRDPSKLSVGQALGIRVPDQIHRVTDGENLYSVAQLYSRTANELWRSNPQLGGRTALRVGEDIVIPWADSAEKPSIAVNGYVYPSVNRDILRKTLPYLTYMTVYSYGIEEDGELEEPDGDEEIINLAREYGVAPIMQISNIDDDGNFSPELAERLLDDRALRNTLTGEIIRTVAEKRYSGVLLDFEYIGEDHAAAYAEFLSELSEKLASGGYTVFASLSPKCGETENDILCRGQDFAEIGKAAGKVFLQSYGWSSLRGPAGAISPIEKVRESVSYAAGEISPEKILLGIPAYGYDFTLPMNEGQAEARPLGSREAEELALERNAEIKYDRETESPYFGYFVENGGEAKEHEVHFSDIRSAEAMLRVADEFGLGGVSLWTVMKYFPAFWLLLNERYSIQKVLG